MLVMDDQKPTKTPPARKGITLEEYKVRMRQRFEDEKAKLDIMCAHLGVTIGKDFKW